MKKTFSVFAVLLAFVLLFSACGKPDAQSESQTQISPQAENSNIDLEYSMRCTDMGAEFAILEKILYGRGNNSNNFLGKDLFYDEYVKIAENVLHVDSCSGTLVYLTEDGNVYGLGRPVGGALQVIGSEEKCITEPKLLFENCKYVSVGTGFALAIKSDGSLWFWGESKNGQSGEVKDYILEPVKISDNVQFARAFGYTSAWIDNQGSLYLCGDNSFNQIGNGQQGSGLPTMYQDIVASPYRALENCVSFEVTENTVINAETKDGKAYMWGNHHSAVPTLKSEEMPPETQSTKISSGVMNHNDDGSLSSGDGAVTFYIESSDTPPYDLSVISKTTVWDSANEKKILKSNIVPPFSLYEVGGALTVANENDDCLYLISYTALEGGRMNNISMSVLFDRYAVPVYVMDSSNLVLALPNSDRELIFNTQTRETKEGDFWDYAKLDNKPAITDEQANSIALKELSNEKYKEFSRKKHSFSTAAVSSLSFKPKFPGDIYSWVTPACFDNSVDWCWRITVCCDNDDLCTMLVYIDAESGDVLYVLNSSD